MSTMQNEMPDCINVRYERHKSGLFCAISDDLKGLHVSGPSLEAVQEDVLLMAAELIRERTGEMVRYAWVEPEGDGFVPVNVGCLERQRSYA